MKSCFELLSSVPDVVWAAVVAAVGVIIGALFTWVGVGIQLRHDSKEREKERQMLLRRDVYLFAIGQFGESSEYLGNFYQTKEPEPRGYSTAIEKIHVIASNETIKALSGFHDHMVESFCELVPEKHEINLLEQKLQLLQEDISTKSKEIDKCLEEMKQYNLQGDTDLQKWAVITNDYELQDNQKQQLMEESATAYNKFLKLYMDLAGKCWQRALIAEVLLTPVIIAIRKELNTPFDEEAYKTISKISQEKWKDNVEKYISAMKSKYEKVLQGL